MLCPQEGVYASIYGCIAYISAPLNQMTKKWVNVIAMSSLHARVVYRPSLGLYLYVSDDPGYRGHYGLLKFHIYHI